MSPATFSRATASSFPSLLISRLRCNTTIPIPTGGFTPVRPSRLCLLRRLTGRARSNIGHHVFPIFPPNVRVLAYNRGGYMGSPPAPEAAGDGVLARLGILDLLGFVKFAVDELRVPPRVEGEGGIIILGWSRASVLLIGLLRLLPLLPSLKDPPVGLPSDLTRFHTPLASHLRSVILYDPSGNALGLPPPRAAAAAAALSPGVSPGKVFGEALKRTVPKEFHGLLDEAWEVEPVGKEVGMVLAADLPTAERIAVDALRGVPGWCEVGLVYGTKTILFFLKAAEWVRAQLEQRGSGRVATVEGGGHFGMVTHAEDFVRRVSEVGEWRV